MEGKPTLLQRTFKLEDGKEFVLEYPSNYNDIVDRKLQKLDDEYNEVHKGEMKNIEEHTENISSEDDEGKITDNLDNKENNVEDKEYYQQLNNNDDDFVEVQEDDDNNTKSIEDAMKDFEFVEPLPQVSKQPKERKHSPIKNPEKIKASMRSLNIKAPKWAESLNDKEFLERARIHLSKGSNKK